MRTLARDVRYEVREGVGHFLRMERFNKIHGGFC